MGRSQRDFLRCIAHFSREFTPQLTLKIEFHLPLDSRLIEHDRGLGRRVLNQADIVRLMLLFYGGDVEMHSLLITDLDNTLVGDDRATQRFNEQIQRYRREIGLVYATGRSYGSAQQLMQEKGLLAPDYWITGVGTAIYHQDQLDGDWVEILNREWYRSQILALVRSEFSELILQPEAEQNPWKISFWFHSVSHNSQESDRRVEHLRSRLFEVGLKAQVIFSSNCDLDILPIAANKGNAVGYLRQQLGVQVDRTVVCGDSGNDISLFEQPVCGVIVKNAQPELMQWYLKFAQPYHYLSRMPYAAGILEGLYRFEVLPAN